VALWSLPLQGQVTSAAGPHDALIERKSAP
jgi:hypothetical protein